MGDVVLLCLICECVPCSVGAVWLGFRILGQCPKPFMLALPCAACQQSRLGATVGNWLKGNPRPPASLLLGLLTGRRRAGAAEGALGGLSPGISSGKGGRF